MLTNTNELPFSRHTPKPHYNDGDLLIEANVKSLLVDTDVYDAILIAAECISAMKHGGHGVRTRDEFRYKQVLDLSLYPGWDERPTRIDLVERPLYAAQGAQYNFIAIIRRSLTSLGGNYDWQMVCGILKHSFDGTDEVLRATDCSGNQDLARSTENILQWCPDGSQIIQHFAHFNRMDGLSTGAREVAKRMLEMALGE